LAGDNRSRTPKDRAFLEFMKTGWSESETQVQIDPAANQTAYEKRTQLMDAFPGRTIVITAGIAKRRSNDTHYRFRPNTEFTQLTNWGSRAVEGSILVIDSAEKTSKLFIRPSADKDSDEFFANSEIGEFWVGPRPDLAQVEKLLGIQTFDLKEFQPIENQLTVEDDELKQFLSEQRIVKSSWEIEQIVKRLMQLKLVSRTSYPKFPRQANAVKEFWRLLFLKRPDFTGMIWATRQLPRVEITRIFCIGPKTQGISKLEI